MLNKFQLCYSSSIPRLHEKYWINNCHKNIIKQVIIFYTVGENWYHLENNSSIIINNKSEIVVSHKVY